MKCKYQGCCGHEHCNLEECPEFVPGIMTNSDRIRAMTDKELAAFLAGKFTDHSTQLSMERGVFRNATSISAEADLWFTVWMQWLRSPAQEESICGSLK